jgi:hypothetical protein
MSVRFVKPTSAELRAYASEIGFSGFDPDRFLDHYDSVGWVVGRIRAPMRDWRAAVRTWRRNQAAWSTSRQEEDEFIIKDYASQARRLIADGLTRSLPEFYAKVHGEVGAAGLKRVRELAEGRRDVPKIRASDSVTFRGVQCTLAGILPDVLKTAQMSRKPPSKAPENALPAPPTAPSEAE